MCLRDHLFLYNQMVKSAATPPPRLADRSSELGLDAKGVIGLEAAQHLTNEAEALPKLPLGAGRLSFYLLHGV